VSKLDVYPDEPAVAAAAADRLTALVQRSMAAHGNAVVSLTGGSTPRRLYSLLGDPLGPWRGRIDWPRLHLFWGDERHVPPDHPDSNYGMARTALLQHVPIPASQIHRMQGELPDAGEAARRYQDTLRAGFTAAGRTNLRFDVMLLGLGEDAHIASIFPGSDLITPRPVTGRPTSVAAVWASRLNAWRITLTPSALLDADVILMIVAGTKKAGAVRRARDAPLGLARFPAQLLRQAGERVEWMIDRAASSDG
jgi:6-phosphogluconolactonase